MSLPFSLHDAREFLEPRDTEEHDYISLARSTYTDTIASLQGVLSQTELRRITHGNTMDNVEDFMRLVQQRCKNRDVKGRVSKVVEILYHYGHVFDIFFQGHTELTSFIWGSIRWLVQVSINHITLRRRISEMLVDLGRSMPRIHLYLTILPSARITQLVSELYAVIVRFLHQSLVFVNKRFFKRLLSACWNPFEIAYEESISKIHCLQLHLERDVIAAVLARQQIESYRFSGVSQQITELTNLSNGILRRVNDHTEISTASLLVLVRDELFRHNQEDAFYYEEVFEYYRLSGADRDWSPWFQKELSLFSWHPQARSTATLSETDTINPQIFIQAVIAGRKVMRNFGYASLLWGIGMTSRTALATIILQLVGQRPELLHFCIARFRFASSFDSLWLVFLDLLQALPGLLIYIAVGSVGVEETSFITRFLELVQTWTGPPINLYVTHPTSLFPGLGYLRDVVNLDDIYDIPASLETSDCLHQIILSLVGVHEKASQRVRDSQWAAAWRLVRYASIGIAMEEIEESILFDCRCNNFGRSNATTTENQGSHCPELRKEVKRFVVKHIELLPLNPSHSTRARLEANATDIVEKRLSTLRQRYPNLVPVTTNEWRVRPFPEVNQKSIFDVMRRILRDACATSISMPLAMHLSSERQPIMVLEDSAVTVRDKTSGITEQEHNRVRSALFNYSPQVGTAEVLAAAVFEAVSAGLREAMDAFIACHFDSRGPYTG